MIVICWNFTLNLKLIQVRRNNLRAHGTQPCVSHHLAPPRVRHSFASPLSLPTPLPCRARRRSAERNTLCLLQLMIMYLPTQRRPYLSHFVALENCGGILFDMPQNGSDNENANWPLSRTCGTLLSAALPGDFFQYRFLCDAPILSPGAYLEFHRCLKSRLWYYQTQSQPAVVLQSLGLSYLLFFTKKASLLFFHFQVSRWRDECLANELARLMTHLSRKHASSLISYSVYNEKIKFVSKVLWTAPVAAGTLFFYRTFDTDFTRRKVRGWLLPDTTSYFVHVMSLKLMNLY